MVDVVDSKSTAGDSVPVRVRSPAPSKRERLLPLSFALWRERIRTHLTPDVRWTSGPPVQKLVASIIFFSARKENVNRVRSPASIFFPAGRKCKSTSTRRCCAWEQPPEGRHLASRSPVTGVIREREISCTANGHIAREWKILFLHICIFCAIIHSIS